METKEKEFQRWAVWCVMKMVQYRASSNPLIFSCTQFSWSEFRHVNSEQLKSLELQARKARPALLNTRRFKCDAQLDQFDPFSNTRRFNCDAQLDWFEPFLITRRFNCDARPASFETQQGFRKKQHTYIIKESGSRCRKQPVAPNHRAWILN